MDREEETLEKIEAKEIRMHTLTHTNFNSENTSGLEFYKNISNFKKVFYFEETSRFGYII